MQRWNDVMQRESMRREGKREFRECVYARMKGKGSKREGRGEGAESAMVLIKAEQSRERWKDVERLETLQVWCFFFFLTGCHWWENRGTQRMAIRHGNNDVPNTKQGDVHGNNDSA
jgi:hypothetical protein